MRRFPFTLFALILAAVVLLWGQFSAEDTPESGLSDVGKWTTAPELVTPPARTQVASEDAPRVSSLAAPPWIAWNQEGIAALQAQDYELAVSRFAACLEQNPNEVVFAYNLAEAYARWAGELHNGDLWDRTRSIELLEEALELHPERTDLGQRLARYQRSEDAEEDFYTRHTLHFEVAFDLNRTEVRGDVETLVRALEDTYQHYGEVLGIRPADQGRPLRVVIYTQEGFSQVTQIGEWAGGVYDGTIRVPVGDLSRELVRVISVLRHELLHAFVHELGGVAVPGWLNEGLAQWLERGPAGPVDQDLERSRAAMASGRPFDLKELEGSIVGWTDSKAIGRAYAQSLLLVAHIEHGYGLDVLREMVAGCSEGQDPVQVFEAKIGVGMAQVMADALAGG